MKAWARRKPRDENMHYDFWGDFGDSRKKPLSVFHEVQDIVRFSEGGGDRPDAIV